MQPKFRFDLVKSHIIFCLEDGLMTCSFDNALRQIIQLENNPIILDTIFNKARQRIVKRANDPGFLRTIEACKEIGLTGAFYTFLFESLHEYIVEQNVKCVRATTLLHGFEEYIRENNDPLFKEMKSAINLFVEMDLGFFPNKPSSTRTFQYDVFSGDTYYSAELSVNAFLIMFRAELLSLGMTVRTCTVCGKAFCGKPEDTCCGATKCKDHLESTDSKQKAEDLASISKKFSLYVRQYRYRIKEKCESEKALQEYNSFTDPLHEYISEKVKELKINDAPIGEIRKLKMEADQKYAEINEKAKEIIAKYSKKTNK